jgi:hypothetical protein
MIEIVWEFQVCPENEAQFELHYGPEGTWGRLFRKCDAFQSTTLLKDTETNGRYLTVDRWQDLASYEDFRSRYAAEYQRIDEQMERLTQSEKRMGVFESV